MVILVAGPFSSGAKTQADRDRNLAELNRVAYEVFRRGHTPVVGVNLALPIIEAAGQGRFDEIMMPVCLGIATKCDAVLRVGGPSSGADQEVEFIRKLGRPVFHSVEELPAGEVI